MGYSCDCHFCRYARGCGCAACVARREEDKDAIAWGSLLKMLGELAGIGIILLLLVVGIICWGVW